MSDALPPTPVPPPAVPELRAPGRRTVTIVIGALLSGLGVIGFVSGAFGLVMHIGMMRLAVEESLPHTAPCHSSPPRSDS